MAPAAPEDTVQARPDRHGGALADDAVQGPIGAWPSVPGYEILGELSHGAMGVVYQARTTRPGSARGAAVTLTSSTPSRAASVHEAEAVARLSHPNIVQVYKVGKPRAASSTRWSIPPGQPRRDFDGAPLPPGRPPN